MVHAVRPNLMLAQAAKVHPDGTVDVLGGGLSVLPHTPTTVFIAGVIVMPSEAAGTAHKFRFELLDEHGPVEGDQGPAFFEGQFVLTPRIGIGLPANSWLTLPVGQPVQHGTLDPGARHEWRYEIDGETREDWSLGFVTMPEAQS